MSGKEKTEWNMQQNISRWVINSLKVRALPLFSFSVCSSSLVEVKDHFPMCVPVCPDEWVFSMHDLFISFNTVDVILIRADDCLLPFV